MIRVLVMIAVAGFLVATVALGSALAIGGPDAIARGVWAWGPHAWDGDWSGKGHWRGHARWADNDDDGPQAGRVMVWTGGSSVELDVPAEMTFTQAPGPARLTINGRRAAVDAVEIVDGHIRFRDHVRSRQRLTITMTAPNITSFGLSGRSRLVIAAYDQDRLRIDLTGDSEVAGQGRTKALELDLSGDSEADFGDLAADSAEVDVSGEAEAIVAPRDYAKVHISGSGDVTLKTRPARLETELSGDGKLHQEDGPTPSLSPSPPPSPPASPPAASSSRR
ncbi:MAG: DUF2807 domain-containing protein [Phenylobacterium sp.]